MTQPDEPWTVGRLLSWTIEYLGKHGAENPRLDAEVLLAEARACRRIDLYAAYGEVAPEPVRESFRELVRRRAAGTPVAYLVGRREFYSLDFEVTPDVLVPRPETEHVVVALLDQVKQRTSGEEAISIADVGTGSGILAVCAAKYVRNSRVVAIDRSPAALEVAKRNAARHGVADQITFVESDLFAALSSEDRFDYVVSNPPYITSAEMETLATDVREHEPQLALHGGVDGLDVIRPLIDQVVGRLNDGGSVFIEVSPTIAERVQRLIKDRPELMLGSTVHDLAGHPRVVHAQRR